MKILALDTALGACGAGVFDGGRVLAARAEPMARGHQERLAVLTREMMAEAGQAFGQLDRIAVTVGPGSFTGLRVGLAFALGLGAALDRPVVGISTLDALAASGPEPARDGLVAAVIDARRGQVYARLYRDGAPLGPAEPLDLDAAATRLAESLRPGETARLIGTGAPLLAEALAGTSPLETLPLDHPDLAAVARLGLQADPAKSPPRPLYLRAPDATPPTRRPGQPRS